ncbi:hypothetical protein [Spirosoma agri]|uniref:Uncharacterized protein n=1 Tax=Spirosoma agri TaxID=1987381 RepID=A0A6M0IN34_9BACT|nr:hypothetical protein [Spirosoma agri]NEU68333.1 hypothetical protein [Spirosoma agri]
MNEQRVANQPLKLDARDINRTLRATKLAIDDSKKRLAESVHRQQALSNKLAGLYLKIDVLGEFIQKLKTDWGVI